MQNTFIDPNTAGYIAIVILSLLTVSFFFSQRLLRSRAAAMPEASLKKSTPAAPDGLCATTLRIANYSHKPIQIRNIHMECGTFAGNEIRNIMGQIQSYQKGTDIIRPFPVIIEPETQNEDPIVFHAQVGIPATAELVGSNGIYDVHIRQAEATY